MDGRQAASGDTASRQDIPVWGGDSVQHIARNSEGVIAVQFNVNHQDFHVKNVSSMAGPDLGRWYCCMMWKMRKIWHTILIALLSSRSGHARPVRLFLRHFTLRGSLFSAVNYYCCVANVPTTRYHYEYPEVGGGRVSKCASVVM